jgi:carbon-monoxide dehydrogenase medium subunit
VKPAPFGYADPTTVEDALDVLAADEGAKVLAGGQSLLPLLSMRLAAPTTLVDINRVPGLDRIEATPGGVRVGALVRHVQLLRSAEAAAVHPLLGRATANVAHPAIRNRGTTVGSIAHADPSGEMTSVLALTDGSVTVATPGGRQTIGWRDFFVGPLETSVHGPAPRSPRSPGARATTRSAARASSSPSTRTGGCPARGRRTSPSGWCPRCTT